MQTDLQQKKMMGWLDWAAWAVVAAGLILAVFQFLFNRTIYGDEAFLSSDILERDFGGLLLPLDRGQVAPVLFLLIQKAVSLLIPHSELGFRLVPLIAWCLSLGLFWGVLRRVLKSPAAVVLGLALFVFDQTLLRYSNEGKQYIVDLLVAVSMAYFVVSGTGLRRWIALALAGIVGVFLSNIAPVVLFGCGVFLLYESFSNQRKSLFWVLGVGAVWLIAFGVYYELFIAHHPLQGYMVGYWEHQGKFMPLNPLHKDFWKFGKDTVLVLFGADMGFGSIAAVVFFLLFIVGLFSALRQRLWLPVTLFVLPIVVHLALSAVRLYPMADRMALYLTPGLIVLVAMGAEYLLGTAFAVRYGKVFSWAVPGLIVVLIGLYAREGYPFQDNEVKPVIDYLVKNANDDTVYWYWGVHVVQFYRAIGYPLPAKGVYVDHGTDTNQYFDRLGSLHGRVWLVFDYVEPKGADQFVLSTLEAKGIRPVEWYKVKGAEACLVILP